MWLLIYQDVVLQKNGLDAFKCLFLLRERLLHISEKGNERALPTANMCFNYCYLINVTSTISNHETQRFYFNGCHLWLFLMGTAKPPDLIYTLVCKQSQ